MEPTKILIVDDEPLNIDIFKEILTLCTEYSWETAMSGEEALDILNRFSPDIIILDIMMPGIDGYEVCRKVKKDPRHRFAKIIMVSGRAMESERLKGYAVGADDYVSKPFSEKELLAKLEVYAQLVRSEAVEELEREQQKTKASLDASEERYRSMFEESLSVMLMIDPGTIDIVDANPAACNFYGYSKEQFAGKNIAEINILPKEKLLKEIVEICERRKSHYLFQHRLANGEIKDVEVYTNLICWGERKFLFSIIHDISERIKAEKERDAIKAKALLQDKMASIGQTATGIAHEINQPLTYINIMLQSTLRDIEHQQTDSKELSNDCRESLQQVDRIRRIIDHLRTFGRDNIFENFNIKLKDVLSNAMIIMGEQLRLRNIQLNEDIQPDLPTIEGDANKLEQVFINLLQNAIDALEDRNNKRIDISMQSADGMIIIQIDDNGAGIVKEIADRIFEPFFSTKEVGKGTGLGLSVAFGIILEHKGIIRCEPGSPGTRFIIELPVENNGK